MVTCREAIVVTVLFGLLAMTQKEAAAFSVGVGIHTGSQNAAIDFDAISRLGVSSFRDEVFWGQTEVKRNVYALPKTIGNAIAIANKTGVKPLIILDYSNRLYEDGSKTVTAEWIRAFTQYAVQVVRQLKGRVGVYEIWNEWDINAKFTTTPESYFELLKSVVPAIRSVDPNIKILAGAVTTNGIQTGWAEKLVRLGALKYADGISLHPYIHCAKDSSPEAWRLFIVDAIAKLQRANGSSVPVYISEMGWPTHKGACGISTDLAAQYMSRMLFLSRTIPAIQGVWIYDLKNDGDDINNREHNFGLLDFTYHPKPAFQTVHDTIPFVLEQAKFTEDVIEPSGIEIITVDNRGDKSYVLWTKSGKEMKVAVALKGSGRKTVEVFNLGDRLTSLIPLGHNETRTTIKVNGYPTALTGIDIFHIEGVPE